MPLIPCLLPKQILYIPIEDFPTTIQTNCFGFAISDTENLSNFEDTFKFDMDHHLPIEKAFLKKLEDLGYEKFPRQISSTKEAMPNEMILMVFDFTPRNVQIPFIGIQTYYDYHVIRRTPEGHWEHKPGWKEPPCEVSSDAEWENIFEEFGHQYALFAFEA